MGKPDLKLIAAYVRDQRMKKDWSQEKLGQEAGLATNTVFSIEQGLPTFKKSRDRIAAALDIDLEIELE